MDYIRAFLVGGFMCAIGQVLMDTTNLTPARILVSFVTLGVILGAFNLYDIFIKVGGAGATVPLIGFGNTLVKATIKEVNKIGLLGAFTGGVMGAAGGISAAVVFGYIMSLLFNPKTKQ